MSRIVRGLHTSCRLLEGAASGPAKPAAPANAAKKVTPESLGFVPLGASRVRILDESLARKERNDRNDRSASNNDRQRNAGPRSNQPRESRPRGDNIQAVSSEVVEGSTRRPAPRPRDGAPRAQNAEGAQNTQSGQSAPRQGLYRQGGGDRGPRGPRTGGAGGGAGAASRGAGASAQGGARGQKFGGKPKPKPRFDKARNANRQKGKFGEQRVDISVPAVEAQAAEINAKLLESYNPRSQRSLFGHSPILRPTPVRVEHPEKEWWANGLSSAEARKALALRLAGDYTTQAPANPLKGSGIDRAVFAVAMNRTIKPAQRAEANEVLKSYIQ